MIKNKQKWILSIFMIILTNYSFVFACETRRIRPYNRRCLLGACMYLIHTPCDKHVTLLAIFKKSYKNVSWHIFLFYFLFNFISNVKGKKPYTTCTVQISNNRQLNTLIAVHTEVERDPSKKKRLHIVHTDKGITKVQKKVLLNREDLFEPPQKHFHLGWGERSHIKLRVYFKLNNKLGYKFGCSSFLLHCFAFVVVLFYM